MKLKGYYFVFIYLLVINSPLFCSSLNDIIKQTYIELDNNNENSKEKLKELIKKNGYSILSEFYKIIDEDNDSTKLFIVSNLYSQVFKIFDLKILNMIDSCSFKYNSKNSISFSVSLLFVHIMNYYYLEIKTQINSFIIPMHLIYILIQGIKYDTDISQYFTFHENETIKGLSLSTLYMLICPQIIPRSTTNIEYNQINKFKIWSDWWEKNKDNLFYDEKSGNYCIKK